MPPEPIDPARNFPLFQGGILLLSIVACMNVIHMRRSGAVLPYEPRRPVPWGPIGCILAMTYLLMTAMSAFGGDGDGHPEPHTASSLSTAILVQSLIVGGFVFAIAAFSKATPRDLGLPMKQPVSGFAMYALAEPPAWPRWRQCYCSKRRSCVCSSPRIKPHDIRC